MPNSQSWKPKLNSPERSAGAVDLDTALDGDLTPLIDSYMTITSVGEASNDGNTTLCIRPRNVMTRFAAIYRIQFFQTLMTEDRFRDLD